MMMKPGSHTATIQDGTFTGWTITSTFTESGAVELAITTPDGIRADYRTLPGYLGHMDFRTGHQAGPEGVAAVLPKVVAMVRDRNLCPDEWSWQAVIARAA